MPEWKPFITPTSYVCSRHILGISRSGALPGNDQISSVNIDENQTRHQTPDQTLFSLAPRQIRIKYISSPDNVFFNTWKVKQIMDSDSASKKRISSLLLTLIAFVTWLTENLALGILFQMGNLTFSWKTAKCAKQYFCLNTDHGIRKRNTLALNSAYRDWKNSIRGVDYLLVRKASHRST